MNIWRIWCWSSVFGEEGISWFDMSFCDRIKNFRNNNHTYDCWSSCGHLMEQGKNLFQLRREHGVEKGVFLCTIHKVSCSRHLYKLMICLLSIQHSSRHLTRTHNEMMNFLNLVWSNLEMYDFMSPRHHLTHGCEVSPCFVWYLGGGNTLAFYYIYIPPDCCYAGQQTSDLIFAPRAK